MVGARAFYYEVKYPELFGTVTSYAGTYHHLYHKGSQTVGESSEKAFELYNNMMQERRYSEESNVLYLVSLNADKICGKLRISIHIGMNDILFCNNEIMYLYLDSLNIPHEYRKLNDAEHDLSKIC